MTCIRRFVVGIGCVAAALIVSGCAARQTSDADLIRTFGKAEQSAITPDQALQRLMEGNRRFTTGKSTQRDYLAQAKAAADGQYPFAVVLSCIDSRCSPEITFDQGIGDLFVPRVAGNYAPVDILGSMEFATKVAGAKVVVVVGHNECGAIKGACDDVELGNLTAVIRALRPAVEDVRDVPDDQRKSKNKAFVTQATEANVRRTLELIREQSEIMRELEESGQLKIVGALQDIATGQVTILK